MKKTKITFIPISGSGALHLDFKPGPFGPAVEALSGDGIGFFSSDGALLGVTFDDVNEENDHQVLRFKSHKIEIFIKNKKITHFVSVPKKRKLLKRKSPARAL